VSVKTQGKEFNLMHYLYGSKKGVSRRLVATFDSEPLLLNYVRWATLESTGERSGKFEQGSPLVSYNAWEHSPTPLTDDDAESVVHNPSPSML
jgi:hypothetical protein